MANLHLWGTTRYHNFEKFKTLLSNNPIEGKLKIKDIIVHRRKPLNTGFLFNFHQVCLKKSKIAQIHMIVLDDWDFTNGASPEIAIKILNSVSEISSTIEKVIVICVDFTSRAEFSSENNFQKRLGQFKSQAEQISFKNKDLFHYFDDEDYLDFTHCNDGAPLGEPDIAAATNHLLADLIRMAEDLEQV